MGRILVLMSLLLVLKYCSSMQLSHLRLEGNETDRQALLAIKYQIRHDLNQVTSSWNDSLQFCMWQGVTCSRRHRQRVTKLELSSLGLVGSISPHVGNLSFLRVLDLENNSFTHQIPPEIGHLHRLQVLYLNNNSLTGTIPRNISNCFQLASVDFYSNNLVGKIPEEMSSLSKLQFLVFDGNSLTGGIPPSLGNLSALDTFGVTDNKLEGSIPRSLCNLRKIEFLDLGINMLSGTIPSCIYNLSSIVEFEVTSNYIHGSLPSNLGYVFPNLQWFSNAHNQFTGAIPSSLSNATNLVVFQCSYNKHTGNVPNLRNLDKLLKFRVSDNNLGSGRNGDLNFVSDLINATRLLRLELQSNNFGGIFPTSLANLSTDLASLSFGGNHLHGSVPVGLGNLVNLQTLSMDQNNFEGSIPTDITKLAMLGQLFLSINRFSGSIPSSFGNLTTLTDLYLSGNNLNSSIPSSLGECQRLEILDLSENRFKGKVPPQLLTGLVSLSISLNLSSNRLNGTFPVEIGKLRALGQLDISNNMFSGKLPSSIGGCQSLEVLHLQGNFFNGLIPSSMQELKGVRDIDLSRNNFTGNVPHFLEGFRYLEHINLSSNQFSGELPTGGVFKNATATMVVGNAGLCGGVASLRLPLCKSNKSKGGGLSRRMKILISLVSGFGLLGVLVLICVFLLGKKKRKECNIRISDKSVLQVSYATLLKATNGFSSSNLIGVGAFGSVYKGILLDGKVVAVKVLNMSHRGASKSFMAECAALRNIRHRNLVKILTACSSIDFSGNNFKALVYEFMENGSLEEWLHPSTKTEEDEDVTATPTSLSLVQRLGIAIDVASALDYLHNHCETPIVHCDLKPSNVLLGSDLTGHVSDFGLSRFLSKPATIVSGNQSSSIGIRGSVGYAAPEYGMGSEISTNGDIYSFGILLLEVFTGMRPTDPMFNDGLNIHTYAKTNLPKLVLEITESLLQENSSSNVAEALRGRGMRMSSAQKIEECLSLILGIGISCSVDSPTNRKGICDVASELQSIRRNLLS